MTRSSAHPICLSHAPGPPIHRPSPLAAAFRSLDHGADLERSAVCTLADRTGDPATTRPTRFAARYFQWTVLGGGHTVPHDWRPRTLADADSRDIEFPGIKCSYIRELWRQVWSVFLQPRRGQPRCRVGSENDIPPSVLLRTHESKRRRRHHSI